MMWEQSPHLNVNKTKELIIDLKRARNKPNTISVVVEGVEVVEDYRYLAVHLENRLTLNAIQRRDRTGCSS